MNPRHPPVQIGVAGKAVDQDDGFPTSFIRVMEADAVHLYILTDDPAGQAVV
jgi:hypothetical protein